MSDPKETLATELRYYDKIVGVAVFFIAFGTVFYHFVEHLKWLDSLYFTVVTLATIGYGDIVPKTDVGKLFTVFYILIGITIFVALARVIVERFAYRRLERRDVKKNK
jgi:voltage-gated potassium channel